LALAALALVVFGAYDSYPKIVEFRVIEPFFLSKYVLLDELDFT